MAITDVNPGERVRVLFEGEEVFSFVAKRRMPLAFECKMPTVNVLIENQKGEIKELALPVVTG